MRKSHVRLAVSLVMIMALNSLIGNPGHSQAEAPGEYQVKAAFLYHFATFVDWPASVFSRANEHFRVCIIGKDPFGKSLDTTLRSKKIHDHELEIRRNPPKTELHDCHVLYLARSQSTQPNTFHKLYGHTNVLTVGENKTFIEHGGMIEFFMENQKVRFAINPKAVKQANLTISSKLLRLAKIVSP